MKDDGGPAFPMPRQDIDLNGEFVKFGSPGMSLRDWFAGQCLSGHIAWEGLEGIDAELIAACAYEMADALLAQRAKKGDE